MRIPVIVLTGRTTDGRRGVGSDEGSALRGLEAELLLVGFINDGETLQPEPRHSQKTPSPTREPIRP